MPFSLYIRISSAAWRLALREQAFCWRTPRPFSQVRSVRFSGLPKVNPCIFFCCKAALVRLLMSSRSCWASTAKITKLYLIEQLTRVRDVHVIRQLKKILEKGNDSVKVTGLRGRLLRASSWRKMYRMRKSG
jgi:hypothetical protein